MDKNTNSITCTTIGDVTFRVNSWEWTVPAGTHTIEIPESPTKFEIVEGWKNLTELDASHLDVTNITDMSGMFLACYKLESLDLSGWDTSHVTNMNQMFDGCSVLSSIKGIEDWDVSNVKDMHKMFYMDGIFSGHTSYGSLDLSRWDVSNVKDMHDMFAGCASLIKLDITGWNTANVTDMSSMFDGCSNLTTLEGISNFDTSKAIGMSSMFCGCHELTTLDLSGWDTQNVTTMNGMFQNCTALAEIKGIENWNTANVARMDDMFAEGTSLKSLDLSGWNTSNVETMYYMFYDCNAITELDLSKWDTRNVSNMRSMFELCSKLESLNLSDWDVSNVKDMNYMFKGCTALTSVHGIKNWDVSRVNDMREMFSGCNKLTTLDVSGWNTRYVVDMNGMFDRCNSISYLDLSKWNTANVENMGGMFQKCGSLTTLNLNGWNMENVESKEGLFADCKSLTSVITKGCDVKTIRQLSEECPKTAVLSNDECAATPVEKASQKGKGQTAENRALDLFADMMIEKISKIKDDWKQPWFTEGCMRWPKNLSGREYNGLNAVMLMLHCEKNNYKLPVFMTFDRVASLNYQKDKQGKRSLLRDDKGEPLPHVGVNKGAKAFPVFVTTFTCIDKDTKERIKYDDYKLLSNEEKQNIAVYPKLQVYQVFNVAQTNIQEARPELYAKLEAENQLKRPENMQGEGEQFAFPAVDTMITEHAWLCPINPTYQDGAYYSISKDHIVIPEKRQFVDGESYYGTLLHEMTHSTGAEKRLGRIKPSAFGSADYAKEELVAELGASLVCSKYGIEKQVKDDSCAYIKSWLDSLHESPDFIKTVLLDVKRASSLITQRINEVQECLDQGKNIPDNLRCDTENTPKEQAKDMYYSQVAYIEDQTAVAELRGSKDSELIPQASQYDQGDAIDMEQTYVSLPVLNGETILAENDLYAVVLNEQADDSISVWRKVSEQEVRSMITRYGLADQATEDVKNLAKEMVADEFAEMVKDRIPCIETAAGVTYIQYNKEKDTLEAGGVTNAGMMVEHSIPYMHSMSLEDNIVEISEVIICSEQMQMEQSVIEAEENIPYNIEDMDENEKQAIVAEPGAPSISDEDVMTKLDNFMQQYYWGARRDHGMRMSGFTQYEDKPALRLTIDSAPGESLYIVTHEQDAAQKDHFFMHLMDGDKEIFKTRELPDNREDAYPFIHGAVKEQADYEYEKRYQSNEDQDKTTHRSR